MGKKSINVMIQVNVEADDYDSAERSAMNQLRDYSRCVEDLGCDPEGLLNAIRKDRLLFVAKAEESYKERDEARATSSKLNRINQSLQSKALTALEVEKLRRRVCDAEEARNQAQHDLKRLGESHAKEVLFFQSQLESKGADTSAEVARLKVIIARHEDTIRHLKEENLTCARSANS
jgi:hypothetical protein